MGLLTCLCLDLPEDDPIEVETCRRNKLLFINGCATFDQILQNKNNARNIKNAKFLNLQHFHDKQGSSLVKAIIKTRNCYTHLDLRYTTVADLSSDNNTGTIRTRAMKQYASHQLYPSFLLRSRQHNSSPLFHSQLRRHLILSFPRNI